MQRIVFVWLLALLSTSVHAAEFTILANSPTWNPSTEVSPTQTISIFNNVNSSSDVIASWTLGLSIVRTTGAGDLFFATAGASSTDYLFAGNSLAFSQPTTLPDDAIPSVGDFHAVAGVSLGATETKNLLDVSFQASPGAAGTFEIQVTPFTFPDAGSHWLNDSFSPAAFNNSQGPSAGAIGTVTLVPEPAGLNWMIGGIVLLVGYGRRRGD